MIRSIPVSRPAGPTFDKSGFEATDAKRRHCANDPLSTEIRTTEESGFQRCSNVLRNANEWREVYAMMKLGYARVSTSEQDTAAQVSALKSAGCEKIFREKASGGRWDRPELIRLLDQLRGGDILIVSRLDRLSRSLRDLLMERIKEAEAGFRSLTEAIDTTTAPGRMMMQNGRSICRVRKSNSPREN